MNPVQTTTAAEVLDHASTPSSSPQDPKTPATAPDEKISGKLRLLIGREKSAVEKERVARVREAELESRLSAIAEREKRLEQFESLKKTNPLEALSLLGMTYDDLTAARLNDGQLPADVKIREIEQRLDQEARERQLFQEQRAKEAQEIAERQEREHTEKFKTEIRQYIKDNASRYELIEFEQVHDLPYEVIEEHYERTQALAAEKLETEGGDPSEAVGEVLTIAQAADKVEEHLEKKYQKSRELNKVQSLMKLRAEKTETKPTQTPPSQKPKTLNNQMSATAVRPERANRILTDEERLAKAIAYARGLRI